QSLINPQAPAIPFAANDFRLNPNTRKFETQAGGARFGHAIDDFGNRFLCNIRNPVIHVVLPAHYLARNPHVPVRSSLFDCAETGDTLPVYRSSPAEPWRAFRAARWTTDLEGKLYPKSELVPGGYFTSASGVTVYRGDAWGDEYRQQVFLSDVASNVIHRQSLTADGVSFRARRIDQETEFVRSTDTWFRPVNFTNAPDGTLHVVDMYRETIEHPWSIPDDIKAVLDLHSGRERGRIWRIARQGFHAQPLVDIPGTLSTNALVPLLARDNGWLRETAARLIFERQDRSIESRLRDEFRLAQSPGARVAILWSLQGLKLLRPTDIQQALSDAEFHVREQAVLLAEPLLPTEPALLSGVLALARDDSPRVRMQVAFTLGETTDPRAVKALAQIARHDADDEFLRSAVLSSVASRSGELLTDLLMDTEFAGTIAARPLFRLLAQSIAARGDAAELRSVAEHLRGGGITASNRVYKIELVQGLGEGLKRRGKSLAATLPDAAPVVDELLADARATAIQADAPTELREQAVQLLALGRLETVREPLLTALETSQPGSVQLAAMRALSTVSAPNLPALLLERWRGATPALRGEIIESLLARPDRIPALLDAIERGAVGATQLAPSRRGMLIRHSDSKIKERARKLFSGDEVSPRKEVIALYQKSLAGTPDRKRGQLVFERECITCHRLGDKGYAVGPNLETIRHHAPEQVLTNMRPA
ncbi:MAG: HEAT repeat domain-containing protein, partial [Planctomycetota bacterium]|nr:HEAT repeat domain-containing protein [Planctomycetota bacterium]